MSEKGAYYFLGYSLLPGGVILAPFSYLLLNSPPLAALGISMVMLGLTSLALGRTMPRFSSEASQAFLQAGMENTSALIEELGLTATAIYLPACLREGKPQAIIPLLPETVPRLERKVPGRLIVRYGPNPQDIGIAVSTLGSVTVDGTTDKLASGGRDIEETLSRILVGKLDLATSVRAIISDGRVEVEVSGPKLHYDNIWFYRCLGSPLASIAATVTAEALNRPVRIKSEAMEKGKSRIDMEILS